MQTQIWASLVGVVLGGGLSYLAQLTAGRQAGRAEDRREAARVAEARRAEQLELLHTFIRLTQQGIRLAWKRDEAADWLAADTPEWHAAAEALIDDLWISERMIQVLFEPELYQRAWDYASAVDHVLWQDPAEAEVPMETRLRGPQTDFLRAAHEELG